MLSQSIASVAAALLVIFFLLTVGALGLFAFKANMQQQSVKLKLLSKESAVLFLNVFIEHRYCQHVSRHFLSNVIPSHELGFYFCRCALLQQYFPSADCIGVKCLANMVKPCLY